MRIFILLLLSILISSCRTGSDMRADLNLFSLTVNSEEEYRNLPLLTDFKSTVDKHEFTVNVPIQLVIKRFMHCTDAVDEKYNTVVKVDNASTITSYKNTYVNTMSNMFTGYKIWEIWELDSLSAEMTNVTLYLRGTLDQSSKEYAKRFKNYAQGISDEDSISYLACKF